MTHFKSQQEIWKYLSEDESRRVISDNGSIVGFKDGKLFNFTCQAVIDAALGYPELFKPYIEPKKKRKLYQYAGLDEYKNWTINRYYFRDDEDFKKSTNINTFKRLDYTMIEVDDE